MFRQFIDSYQSWISRQWVMWTLIDFFLLSTMITDFSLTVIQAEILTVFVLATEILQFYGN